jgi:hypothetical protein
MLDAHSAALRQIFKLPRPTARETAIFAALYIAQAVLFGCGMAMAVQIITDILRHLFFNKSLPTAAQVASAAIEAGKQSSPPH